VAIASRVSLASRPAQRVHSARVRSQPEGWRRIAVEATTHGEASPAGEHSPQAWLTRTLEEILFQIRSLLELSGAAFQVVDAARREIEAAASWFVNQEAQNAFGPILRRPYEPDRPGVTEAAIEEGHPLLIPRLERWEGAARLRERLDERLPGGAARHTWEWYRRSSFIACPVRTAGGRTLGVLIISSTEPAPALGKEDLRVIEVFARLAALALERSELLAAEARRAREELLLNRASQAIATSLDPEAVYQAIVEQAALLTGAPMIMLTRAEPGTNELRAVASIGHSRAILENRFTVGDGMIGQVAVTGEPYLSREEDRGSMLGWVLEREGIGSYVHVPIQLGPRLFGVLSASHTAPGGLDQAYLARLVAFGRAAAGAIANALDHQRERHIVHALTRSFVPGPPPALPGLELGLVYHPVGEEVGGGDFFGAWRLDRGVAVLLGDVAGKGLEVASLSSMIRFFVEARTWDADCPSEVLRQVNQALWRRGRGEPPLATAFMAIVTEGKLRYCNAGHEPPLLLRGGGGQEELRATGFPLGVDENVAYEFGELDFAPGDLLFAATDGLIEARRDGELYGEARLPKLLDEHARTSPPGRLVETIRRDVEGWASRRHDDIVILALRRTTVEVRREPPDAEAGRRLFEEYLGDVRARLHEEWEPTERIFGNEAEFVEPDGVWLVLYEDGEPVGCAGLRALEPGVVEFKRMFVTSAARGRGYARRLLTELEAIAVERGAGRVRLLTTEPLCEARALYASAGYEIVGSWLEDEGRHDFLLEKQLP
jgi:GAF domain-containing protein/GNAT superfamily N-acetyltransferase